MNTRPRTRPGKPGQDCKVCRTIRRFLLLAALLLVLVWSQPDWRLPPHYDYSTLVGDLFLLAFVLVFAWKYYVYRREQRAERERERAQERVRALARALDDTAAAEPAAPQDAAATEPPRP